MSVKINQRDSFQSYNETAETCLREEEKRRSVAKPRSSRCRLKSSGNINKSYLVSVSIKKSVIFYKVYRHFDYLTVCLEDKLF